MVQEGEITIDTDEGPIHLKKGEGVVIPKGLNHCPRAKERAVILIVIPSDQEPKGRS